MTLIGPLIITIIVKTAMTRFGWPAVLIKDTMTKVTETKAIYTIA